LQVMSNIVEEGSLEDVSNEEDGFFADIVES
jgi:hypothetical protein